MRSDKMLTDQTTNELKVEVLPLPTTLSGWIRAAVEDAQRIEKLPGFVLDMGHWNNFTAPDDIDVPYDPSASSKPVCRVCLAGAAFLGRGLVAPGNGCDITYDVAAKIGKRELAEVLDYIRVGNVYDALWGWGEGFDPEYVMEVSYAVEDLADEIKEQYRKRDERRADWALYLELARELELRGL
jgi:hypothetical protein